MAITDKLAAIADAIRANTGETDKMTLDQMPAKIYIPPYIAVEAQLQDYRIGEQSSWTYPPQEGMAFAGWFKDSALSDPCNVSDVSGEAWAKMLRIDTLLTFIGASLNMSENIPEQRTIARFAYTMSIPEYATLIENGWYFKKITNPSLPDVRSISHENVVMTGNNVYTAQTFNKIAPKYYNKRFSTKAFVKYVTFDGTTVEAVDLDYRSFSPVEIADAIISNPMANDKDKAYATAIKEAAL